MTPGWLDREYVPPAASDDIGANLRVARALEYLAGQAFRMNRWLSLIYLELREQGVQPEASDDAQEQVKP